MTVMERLALSWRALFFLWSARLFHDATFAGCTRWVWAYQVCYHLERRGRDYASRLREGRYGA